MIQPQGRSIYHITPIDALPHIVEAGHLYSNAIMDDLPTSGTNIGITNLKQRRRGMPVHCHEGSFVGEYVPFYFCPRSVMLYLIFKGNHPELDYKGGQDPIMHLEYDLQRVIDWADNQHRLWAFSLSNASATYTQFRCNVEQLDQIDWEAVAARDWRDPEVKEAKQAEFLMHWSVPWHLVKRIGVRSRIMARAAMAATGRADHRPTVEIIPSWYY